MLETALSGFAFLLVGFLAARFEEKYYSGSQGGPIVDLGYTMYEGTSLSNGQNQFLGIRFAAPPLGDLRFRKPQPPVTKVGLQQAKQFGPRCYSLGHGFDGQDEDCLFLSIWSPSSATQESRFPVFFWIQGGGYVSNSQANYNGSELVKSSGNNMIFVAVNYRVGPFGFLASETIRKNGDLNVGMLDQRFALEWVQRNIKAFGGDPNRVVLVGASAGAGSALLHMIAYGGAPTNLFHGVYGVSPFLPSHRKPSELEWQFHLYASRVGCDSVDILGCLRSQNSTKLQMANLPMPFPSRMSNALFPFAPTIDGDFLQGYPYQMFEEGRYVKVPAILGVDTDEGTMFTRNMSTPKEVSEFLQDNFPRLSDKDLKTVNKIYPIQKPNPFKDRAAYFPSGAAAIGDTLFVCPALILSNLFSQHTKAWSYRFNVLTPTNIAAGLGVRHASECDNLFGPGNTPAGSTTDTFNYNDISLTPILRAYFTSFVRSLDPNSIPVDDSVFWPELNETSDRRSQRLLIQTNATTVETIPQDQIDKCEFWGRLGSQLQQ